MGSVCVRLQRRRRRHTVDNASTPRSNSTESLGGDNASSKLSVRAGSVQETLIVDFPPEETATSFTSHSPSLCQRERISPIDHENCAKHVLRVDTTFQITGGTGAFQGATSGREFGAVSAARTPGPPSWDDTPS
jgi:hypothetical protein